MMSSNPGQYAMTLMAVLLSGCGSISIPPQTTPSTFPQSTPTVEVLADCFMYFHLLAWEDSDADGVREEGEPPLEGVEFSITGYYAYSFAGGQGTTDAQGLLTIDTWAPGGCGGDDFEIRATPPEGYLASSDTTLKVSPGQIPLDFEFGFYPAFADCGLSLMVYGWQDSNANQLQDDGEPILGNVIFEIREIATGMRVGEAVGNAAGWTEVAAYHLACTEPIADFEVVAIPPEGYQLTTQAAIPLSTEVTDANSALGFGFLPVDDK